MLDRLLKILKKLE